MNTQHTLESVQADFQRWRQNKTSPRSRVPENMKRSAVSLLADLPSGKITKTLGISHTMLKTWAGQKVKNSDTTTAIEFVSLPVDPHPITQGDENLVLDFTQPNGNHWCLQGQVSASQLDTFIRTVGSLPSKLS